jgi:hypothetical protein
MDEVGIAPIALTPFGNHVLSVVFRRAEKQMGGVGAARIVASVTDVHVVGDRAIRQFVGHAMRLHHLFAELEYAVSISVTRAGMFPAFIWLTNRNEFTKALLKHTRLCFALTRSGAKSLVRSRCEYLKRRAAPFARQLNSMLAAGKGAETSGSGFRGLDTERFTASLANDRDGHETASLGRSILEEVGRGSKNPLVSRLATPTQAPIDSRPIISNLIVPLESAQQHSLGTHPNCQIAIAPVISDLGVV